MNRIEIPLSKTKTILLLIVALLFVVVGMLFTINPEEYTSVVMKNSQIIRIAGIAAVLFFGAATVFGVKKLFDKRIGIIIDDNGIADNTNASSIGLIKWTDITEIKTKEVASTKFLLIYVVNADSYLDKVQGFKRKLMESNNNMYGTPISLIASTLKCNFKDLEKLVNDKFNEHRAANRNI